MTQNTSTQYAAIQPLPEQAELDLVVPFITPELTQAALNAATRMGKGLRAAVRLIRIQLVPYPLDSNQSPVFMDFLQEQMAQFRSELPTNLEIRLAREFEPALRNTLTRDSVVILATRKRLWPTRTERLAASLRRHGHTVVLVSEGV